MADKDPDVDELAPSATEGYKAPEQKTLEELKNLDAGDESLQKWKESLLKGSPGMCDSPFNKL